MEKYHLHLTILCLRRLPQELVQLLRASMVDFAADVVVPLLNCDIAFAREVVAVGHANIYESIKWLCSKPSKESIMELPRRIYYNPWDASIQLGCGMGEAKVAYEQDQKRYQDALKAMSPRDSRMHAFRLSQYILDMPKIGWKLSGTEKKFDRVFYMT